MCSFGCNIVVDCGPPPLPITLSEGLSISLPSNATTVGSTALYSCGVGYNRVNGGEFNRTCQLNGNWSGTTPQCQSMMVLAFCKQNLIKHTVVSSLSCSLCQSSRSSWFQLGTRWFDGGSADQFVQHYGNILLSDYWI